MQVRRFEGHTQRLAGAEQVLLAGHLVERARPQPLGQRGIGIGERRRIVRRRGVEQRLLRFHPAAAATAR